MEYEDCKEIDSSADEESIEELSDDENGPTIYRKDDYARESIPMLPVTHGVRFTKLQIILYTVLLLLVSLLPFIVLMSGNIYLFSALGLGLFYLYSSIKMYLTDDDDYPMTSFKYSIYYIFLIFFALLVDHFI